MNREKTILIVDDLADTVKVLRDVLEKKGYVTFGAGSAKEAWDLLQQQKVDLLLLDITMPEVNGIEFCRRMRTRPQFEAIPVIFLTASPPKDKKAEAMLSGGKDYLVKPVKRKALFEVINEWIGPPRKEIEDILRETGIHPDEEE